MKKAGTLLTVLFIFLFAQIEGAAAITLKTMSSFAGTDAAAQTYVELLKEWEETTGNKIEDYSVSSDEAWKASVIYDFAAGNEPDILFYFAKTADSAPLLSRVVPIETINEAYPEMQFPQNEFIAENDGVVYAIPVRAWWEGLFVNTDLFEKYDLALPTTWENLVIAIKKFNQVGIVPISVSFSDIPHYMIEFAILASGTPEEHQARPQKGEQVPDSWITGMEMLNTLFRMGAFPKDCNATTESITSQMFLDKRAAMQVDGSWFANGISEENWDTTIVMPFPIYEKTADPNAIFVGTTSGFYLTKKAWNDPEKREAAVHLLKFLTDGENAAKLGGFTFSGELARSAAAILNMKVSNTVIQDSMRPDVRSDLWFAKIPGVVDGTVDPEKMWEAIIAADPWQ